MSDDESSDFSDTVSVDSCEEYINFESIRVDGLEEAISFSWPGIYHDDGGALGKEDDDKRLRKIVLSTLLEEDDLAPLFDGSRWAGTRLWGAAVRAIQYISGHLPDANLSDHQINISMDDCSSTTMLELGCGLGVPGMIFHMLGGNVVLTDQADILSQLEKNVATFLEDSTNNKHNTIQAKPLSWSREDIHQLLEQLGRSSDGFDIVLDCDCVYEPLYGKSWHLLNETIDELLKINPKCTVISSMERRQGDGIDVCLEERRDMEHVGAVEKIWSEEGKKIEIYVTRGIIVD